MAEGTRSLVVWEEMGGGRGLEVVTLLPSLPCVQAYAYGKVAPGDCLLWPLYEPPTT